MRGLFHLISISISGHLLIFKVTHRIEVSKFVDSMGFVGSFTVGFSEPVDKYYL